MSKIYLKHQTSSISRQIALVQTPKRCNLDARKHNQPRHNNDEATCAKQTGLMYYQNKAQDSSFKNIDITKMRVKTLVLD